MSQVVQASHLLLQPRLEALILALYPQELTSSAQADALFSRSIQLLPLLNNPLNIELLVRHVLQSPAIWFNGVDGSPRYLRILSGFRASLGWKVTDLNEGKGGLSLDEWIIAVGRGATGTEFPWRHLFLFAGLRSAINEDTPVSKKSKRALDHAYARAFSNITEDVTKDIVESILFTLTLMEHINPAIVDDLFSLSPPEHLLMFLVDAMYSPQLGLFQEIPGIITSLENSSDSLDQVQRFDSNILQPHIARISGIISRVFGVTRDSQRLALGIDIILASALAIHTSISTLAERTAQSLMATEPSLSAKTDVIPILWENLKRYLFSTVMSLQGVITNLMQSSARADHAVISFEVLEVMGHLAFISTRFGYTAFDEWNFVYLASIDILCAYPAQAIVFLEKHLPSSLPQHPSAVADALFFLDTLEHFIPILPPETIHRFLPTVQTYLQPSTPPTLRRHLESAHSVYLAILARGDLLQDQIQTYLTQVYSAFPSTLSPRQVRLAFSTVIKLSSPDHANEILTDLLWHAANARRDVVGKGADEQLTYLFAAVDSVPWVPGDVVEFWLEQIVVVGRGLEGRRREEFVKRVWECVSGEVGGEIGMRVVEWWVNGGKDKLVEARL